MVANPALRLRVVSTAQLPRYGNRRIWTLTQRLWLYVDSGVLMPPRSVYRPHKSMCYPRPRDPVSRPWKEVPGA